MKTTSDPTNTPKQSREIAMAETLAILDHAEGWVTLCAATDEKGELTGAAKFYADTDLLTDLMVAAGLNELMFGKAIIRAAMHISRLINMHTNAPNK